VTVHRPTIHGYSDRLSVAPGETIEFKISVENPAPYRADLVRVINGDANPAGPGFREEDVACDIAGEHEGRHQRADIGSFAVVDDPDGLLAGDGQLGVELLVHAGVTDPAVQTLVSRFDPSAGAGWAVILLEGRPALRIGDGERTEDVVADAPLWPGIWYALTVFLDADGGAVIDAQLAVNSANSALSPAVEIGGAGRTESRIAIRPRDSRTALLLAGMYERAGEPWVGDHFNGKLEAPRILRGSEVVAAWDFTREITAAGVASDAITDTGPHGLHGRLVNAPMRAATGRWWTGREEDFTKAPEHYGAIHFHETDLEDCGWDTDIALRVPDDLPSACYALRLRHGDSEEHLPFFVLPPRGTATSDVLLLMPTWTYLAYANDHIHEDNPGAQLVFGHTMGLGPEDVWLYEHPEFGLSMYALHRDGSGVCHSSWLRPITNLRPRHRHLGLWGYAADLHLVDWLDATGVGYDVATDSELHEQGADLLSRYRVVLTPTHPEYYSSGMLDAWETYLGDGGRGMYLGGNGFYWVTGTPPGKPHLVEVRRGESGSRGWQARPGEYHLASTGERSGLWRARARAPQKLFGVGSAAHGWDESEPYEQLPHARDERAAFIMDGIPPDEPIGDFGLIGGGASGHETDRYDRSLGTPPDALLLATSAGLHTDNYQAFHETIFFPHPSNGGTENFTVRGDIVFFTTRNGGGVFSTGSMAWCGSLSHDGYDNNVSRMTRNVLERFRDPQPLDPEETS
jgi:N,N-dimethylformamidase